MSPLINPASRVTLGLATTDSPEFVTVKLSGLTDGYIPKHTSDAVGLTDSPLVVATNYVGTGVTPAVRLHVGGTAATDIIRADIGLDFNPVAAPTAPTLALAVGAGLGTGVYTYWVTYTTALGETNTSTGTAITTTAGNNQVTVTIPVSTDYRVTGRKIYRGEVGINYHKHLVIAIANNTDVTYLDSTADGSLGVTNYYYRTNTTCKYVTSSSTNAFMVDTNMTLLGLGAGQDNDGGGGGVFVGKYAGGDQTSAIGNTFIGSDSGRLSTSGGVNTAVGYWSLYKNLTAEHNTAIGNSSLYNCTGSNNTAVGSSGGLTNTTGAKNCYFGQDAGYTNSTGGSSVFLGFQAGYFETVGSKLYIDNIKRTDLADGKVKALIYGIFAATTAAQYLYINGNCYISDSLNIPTNKQITFRDAAIYAYSSADGWLNLVADTGVEVNAPVLNVATLYSSGAFGCNGKGVQTAYPCAAWDEPGAGAFGVDSAAHMAALVELVKDMQAALVANGIMAVV